MRHRLVLLLLVAVLSLVFLRYLRTPAMLYSAELRIAQLAVQRAALLTKRVSDQLSDGLITVTKDDKLPVTVGDFGAQAVIIHAITSNFAGDEVVGEEDSEALRLDPSLLAKVLALVEETQQRDAANHALLGELVSGDAVCAAIDTGASAGGNTGRIWALDPIDGTKGFIRGDQFAVCLALMVDGVVKVGVIGCPNLPVLFPATADTKRGGLFYAVAGQGAFYHDLWLPVSPATATRISMKNDVAAADATVCEGVEKGHSLHSTQAQIKLLLGVGPDQLLQLDSQAKYCALSQGLAEIYLRLPINDQYREKIWDHAAGNVLVHEAGGVVSDILGNPLDFSKGRTLPSQGVIAASKLLHAQVIEAVRTVLGK